MPPKKRKRKKAKKKSQTPVVPFSSKDIIKTVFVIIILFAVITSAAVLFHILLPTLKEGTPSKPPTAQKTTPKTPKTEKTEAAPASPPIYEIFAPEDKPPVPTPRPRPVTPRPLSRLPKVAIIIDDLGYDSRMLKNFLSLNAPLTLSILPHSPLQGTIARLAPKKGMEIMLHLPMEPVEYPSVNPGPGALLVSMSPDALLQQLESDLNSVAGIKGVNNHMGSRMTTISTQMYQIFTILKKRDLYFVDSRTAKDSLCKPAARLLQLRFAARDIFLDHIIDPNTIRRQLHRLVQIAVEKGEAVGIGHPHEATYQILEEELPTVQTKVTIVPASEIVRPLGDNGQPADMDWRARREKTP